MNMEAIYFVRIQFDGKWTTNASDLAKLGFVYRGTGTITVLRESPNGGLKTYTYVYDTDVVVVVTQDRVIHVPSKPTTIIGGEVFP